MGILRICFTISVCCCITAYANTFNWHLEQSEEKSLGEAENKEQELFKTISFVYYKRLVHQFLDQTKMKYNEQTGAYTRYFGITIDEKDLEMALSSSDPRDWEPILSSAFTSAINYIPPRSCPSSTMSSIKYWLMSTIESSEVKFVGVFLLVLAGVVYINNIIKYSYVAIAVAIVFITGFVYTYLDCNRRLLIVRMVELENGQNFCGSKGWDFLGVFSRTTEKAECIEQLIRKHSLMENVCRPDEVLLMYKNETLLNLFILIAEKYLAMVKICQEQLPFPLNKITADCFMSLIFLCFIWRRCEAFNNERVNTPQNRVKHSEPKKKELLPPVKGTIQRRIEDNCTVAEPVGIVSIIYQILIIVVCFFLVLALMSLTAIILL